MTSSCGPNYFGADPATIKWQIIRGDTSPLRVEFYENDEVTPYNTDGWEFSASTYNPKDDVIDSLIVVSGEGYVEITAPAEITALWGTGFASVVAELSFDLQVIINNERVWTPVLGTITVLGDVTGGSL